jgi:orotidine-5'-phosphate decarboxylase
MGTDSLTPFLQHAGRCAFVLVATSNPGAGDVQALAVGHETVADRVARMAVAAGAGAPGTVGFVVGGTRPERLAELRAAHPDVPFLVPGVGAQGGRARSVMTSNAGGPMLVNASRSILYASPGADFARAARDAASALADELAS